MNSCNQSFDEEICWDQPLSELDLSPLLNRFAEWRKPLTEEKLENLKLVQQEQGTLHPTQGLMILLGKHPHVVVKCARLSVKARRAREVLKSMVEKGLLERKGTARSTYYVKA